MNSLDILDKIDEIRKQKGLSVYRLTKEALVSHNTLNAWRKRQTMPSFGVLEALCDAMDISMAVLFLESDVALNELSAETKKMLSVWETLNQTQKKAVMNLLLSFQIQQ